MSTSASERKLHARVWWTLAAWAVGALVFYAVQNRLRPVGGDISFAKLAWLAYAVLFWFVLPLLLSADPRLPAAWRRPFVVLLALMLARGVAELWMLYVSLNWLPWYGIAHDVVCALALGAFLAVLEPHGGLQRTIRGHLAVTTALFVPEIYFAWYMVTYFNTRGESAIYFVPDDPAHATVLSVTAAVVICLTVYLPLFISRWLYGTLERDRPTPF